MKSSTRKADCKQDTAVTDLSYTAIYIAMEVNN